MLGLLFCLCACAAAAGGDASSRLVQTSQGPVRGYKTDEDLYMFYNIPYATAPTGHHRFKAPLPPPTWFQPLEAVDQGIVCPQADFMNMNANKTVREDCLIANVYVPHTEVTNLPVVVYVHGGAYQMGNGQIATPNNLVRSRKIVAVTFNYRVGIHGFLCLGTKNAPGNAGMKDQVALLRWVNKNIANFGGNPDDVTIAGYSAGSSAVDLLQLSKTTKGLFNKVIPESGANVAVWSVQIDPLQNAKDFAKKVKFSNVENIYDLEEFYTTATFSTLTSENFMDRTDVSFVFSPCVERDVGVERFLEDTPLKILKDGKYNKVPMLYGFANMEGLSRIYPYFNEWKNRMNENFSEFLPADLIFESEEQRDQVAKKIKEFYFGDKAISEETVLGYIDYFTDVTFAYPTLRSVKLQVEAGNDKIYLYEYSFAEDDIPITAEVKVRGANHCAQTAAVLDGNGVGVFNESNISEEFKKNKVLMRQLWLNFMITGTPVVESSPLPTWPPVDDPEARAPHLALDSKPELRGALLQRRARFWDHIYEQHYRSPVPPPQPPPPPRSYSEL